MMNTAEIRQAYLDFFTSRDHRHVPSSDLVPQDDPTLLFTTAGMVQFKRYYDGTVDVPHRRTTSVQKCLRVKGKASDLENVGRTVRHMTFFEMLGNFSFGDYFKQDAIKWAWEFSTQVVKIDPARIWVTIFEDDDEAGDLWVSEVGFPRERIVKMGRKDNFWGPAGETGACGPCSELHYDRGPEFGEGDPSTNDERFLEFWNLVFPQYDYCQEDPKRPLKNRGIDTGMGLERLAMLVQGKRSIFETTEIFPIIEHLSSLVDRDYMESEENVRAAINACVDHTRCLTFAISEGIIPSNEGRGYVMRSIIRRAIRLYKTVLHHSEPVLHRLVDDVVEQMGDHYPQLKTGVAQTRDIVKKEEARFLETIDKGEKMLTQITKDLKEGDTVPGDKAFTLYDTYGYPLEMTKEIASDRGLNLDTDGFEKAMEEQRQLARASWKGSELAESEKVYNQVAEEHGETSFIGYGATSVKSDVLALMRDGVLVDSLSDGQEGEVILSETPFYAESGGQVGDKGEIKQGDAVFHVEDTQKTTHGLFRHIGKVTKGTFEKGRVAEARIDEERRLRIMRHHTATHLLNAALREHLGSHVKQAGAMKDDKRLRFDYTHGEMLDLETIMAVAKSVNEAIMANVPIETIEMPIEEAKKTGAIAVFGEKYGDIVRVVKMGDFSTEFCGGTHLERTGDVGSFYLMTDQSVAAGIRRIEAVAGDRAIEGAQVLRRQVHEVRRELSIGRGDVAERVRDLIQENKAHQKEIAKLRQELSAAQLKGGGGESAGTEVKGIKVIARRLDAANAGDLRNAADVARAGKEKAIAVLGAEINGKAAIIVAVTDDLKDTLPAGKVVAEVAAIVGGKGGGRPDMAQAGGKDVGKIDEAIAKVPEIIESMLG